MEKQSQMRHRALQVARDAADSDEWIAAATAAYSDDKDSDELPVTLPEGEVKKPKVKKPKKPKVTIAEAAAVIDAENLSTHLLEISESYENHQDIQLMRFADYFGRAFASISLCHIPEPVRNTMSDWIGQRSPDALEDFVLWCIDNIMFELSGQAVGAKGSKKVAQQTPRAQVRGGALVCIFSVV
ncbi:hypothetical protein GUJ93_ZPchr0008g11472 [Zizania palustris]|uniref:Uncharacterized protein n=1 Tax=Zizania palustris TaxID=103762 RepID=A0A8J5RV71_ZIZPA|nr:hypothetical protein GUJ93_ZPchr0008g11472 [Zizania palustris]